MPPSPEDESQEFASDWAKRHVPSYGPAWDAAIDFGIDVTLLLENLELTPEKRLARLQQVVRFHQAMRGAASGGR